MIWFSHDTQKSEIMWHFPKETTKAAVKGNCQVIPFPECTSESLLKLAVYEELVDEHRVEDW